MSTSIKDFKNVRRAMGPNRVNMGRNLMPDSLRTTLRYTDIVQTNSGAVFGYNAFNLNSVFDPDRTGTGHQPMGFDQLKPFYNRYRVLKTKISVIFSSTSASGAVGGVVAMNQLITPNYTEFVESPLSAMSKGAFNLTDLTHAKVSQTYSMSQIAGSTDSEYRGSDRFQALTTADPTEIIVCFVFVASLSGTTNAFASVVLDYDVEFFDRNETGLSLALRGLKSEEKKVDAKPSAKRSDENQKELSEDLDWIKMKQCSKPFKDSSATILALESQLAQLKAEPSQVTASGALGLTRKS